MGSNHPARIDVMNQRIVTMLEGKRIGVLFNGCTVALYEMRLGHGKKRIELTWQEVDSLARWWEKENKRVEG